MAVIANGIIKPSERKALERQIRAMVANASAAKDRDAQADVNLSIKQLDKYISQWKEMII